MQTNSRNLKNVMIKKRLYRLAAIGLILMGSVVQAAPDDPLGQMIKQKTTPSATNNTNDELGTFLRNRKPPSVEQHTDNGRGDADELISNAMGFLGVAYRFGGTSPTGFDCSGFMQFIFRKSFSVNLPRTSAEQANVGIPVSRNELRPGDMVFFRTSGNRISHVGMYVGNDRFIHAPRTGKRIEITSLNSQYWGTRYATARRVKR